MGQRRNALIKARKVWSFLSGMKLDRKALKVSEDGGLNEG